jgi:hypothetical protein
MLFAAMQSCAPQCKCAALNIVEAASPADGATNVALDTAIWVSETHAHADPKTIVAQTGAAPPVITLEAPEGDVPGDLSVLSTDTDPDGAVVSLFRPRKALDSHKTYTIKVNGELLGSFTTGTEAATPGAEIPASSVAVHSAGGACLSESADVTLGRAGYLVLEQFEGEESLFTESTLAGRVAAIPPASPFTLSVNGSCGTVPVSISRVRFGAANVAGKFSGWGEWQSIR